MCGTIGPAKWEGLSDRRVFSGSRAVGPTVFTYSGLGRYMLVDNSHTLYIINHSILFLITIHTVTYHTNTQSLQLSCLCLLFHNTLRYLIVSFSIFFSSHTVFFYYFIFLHTIFQIPYKL